MGRIKAGDLKERIALVTTGAVESDGRGGFLASEPDTSTSVWARVTPVSGSEKLRLGQVLNANVYQITIRRLPTASAKQRVTWKGNTLNVLAVVPDEDYEYQTLTCIDSGESG